MLVGSWAATTVAGERLARKVPGACSFRVDLGDFVGGFEHSLVDERGEVCTHWWRSGTLMPSDLESVGPKHLEETWPSKGTADKRMAAAKQRDVGYRSNETRREN